MTPKQFENLVSRITYKPYWEIRCEALAPWKGRREAFELNIIGRVVDSNQKLPVIDGPIGEFHHVHQELITVESRHIIEKHEIEYMEEEQAVQFLFQLIKRVEDHEAQEFFRINGQRRYDPHKENL